MTSTTDPATDKVIHLRKLLRDRFPEAHRSSSSVVAAPTETASDHSGSISPLAAPRAEALTPPALPDPPLPTPEFPLGIPLFDSLDQGRGLSPGTLAEIVCRRPGGGTGTLIAGLIQAAATSERQFPLALIDGADCFDARSLSDSPKTAAALCRHLLWVRCRHRVDHAIKAADLLLRDGNLPLVILDLQLCRPGEVRRGIPGGTNAWYRLRSLGEKTGTIFLTFTAEPLVPAVPWRLELDHTWPLEALDRLPQTGDLRREHLRHLLNRARLTTGEETETGIKTSPEAGVETTPASPQPGPADQGPSSYAIAS